MAKSPNPATDPFPVSGVIGVISSGPEELDLAVQYGLHSVEIRADLLLDADPRIEPLMHIVTRAQQLGLASLFTLRHQSQGGTFSDSEQDRVAICRQAIAAGVDIIDLEWDTEAADALLADNAPIILSHHNFDRMLGSQELQKLTDAMSSCHPAAIKVVPTVTSLGDASRMLQWVESAAPGIRRIGFGMGESGAISRIMTIAFGGPVTYTAFGDPVAPGQIALDELLAVYRAAELGPHTRVLALVDSGDSSAQSLVHINQYLARKGKNCIAIQFPVQVLPELVSNAAALRVDACRIQAAHASEALTLLGAASTEPDGDLLVELAHPGSKPASNGSALTVGQYSDAAILDLYS